MVSVLHRKLRNELRLSCQSLGMERSAEPEAVRGEAGGRDMKDFGAAPEQPPNSASTNPPHFCVDLCLVRNSSKCVVDVYEKQK